MMGTLLEIGAGIREPGEVDTFFESGIRSDAGMTVPSQGLFLDEAYYS